MPKIFCDFPLIGTNDFTLPFVINNPNFNPTEPRDGVWLTDHNTEPKILQNKEIFLNGLELYFELLDFAIKYDWENLFLLANTETPTEKKWLSKSWFEENIQKPIRTKLLKLPIVTLENGEKTSILDEQDKANVYFPYHPKKEVRERIWELEYKLFPDKIPAKEDIHNWYDVVWNDCFKDNLKAITEFIVDEKNIDDLSKRLKNDLEKSIEWLNEYFDLINFEEKFIENIIADKFSVIPNQKGVFKKKSELKFDKNIEEELKNVLEILSVDIRESLIHKDIRTASKYKDTTEGQITYYTRTQEDIVDEINKVLDGTGTNKNPNSGIAISYLISLFSEDNSFPKHREILYQFCTDLIPSEIAEKKIIGQWSETIWKNCDKPIIGRLISIVSESKNINSLQAVLGKKSLQETFDWANSFIAFLNQQGLSEKLNLKTSPILPNQKSEFCIKDDLFLDNGQIDEILKDILEALGNSIKDELLDKNIFLELPQNRERNAQFVADEITRLITPRFSEFPRKEETKVVFKLLFLWFDNNKTEADTLFQILYANKHKLYDDDEIAANVKKAGQLDSILQEFDLENEEELRNRLKKENNGLVLFFGDGINDNEEESVYKNALGFIIGKLKEVNINSIEDFLYLIDNIKAGNILVRSNPNPVNQTNIDTKTQEEKKEFAIQLTSEAIGATIRHLQNLGYEILLEKYNKDYLSIFKVKHKDNVFDLVIRPCHFNRYKLYSHEKEILKNENSELWLSDGNQVMKETLCNLMFRIFDSGAMYIPTKPFVPGKLIG